MRKIIRFLAATITVVVLILTISAAVSALINLNRPTTSADPDALADVEAARIAEYFHAHQALADAVWPGWGADTIPLIAYNEANAFLIGLDDPAAGWVEMPQNQPHGGTWTATGEAMDGLPGYRQPLPASGERPQAFAVLVGDRWVASLPTMEWFRISLANQLHDELPPVVNLVFPYSIAVNQLVDGSDQYISLIAHEAFHAYQGATAPGRLAAAESAVAHEADYPGDDPALEAAWQAELDLLAEAVAAPPNDAAAFTREFLRLRAARRSAAGLAPGLVDYERQREWLEGMARYAELGIWREAAASEYRPVEAILADPDFEGYAGYERRLDREIGQIGRMAGDEGDGRFYYSGYAQAVLLDRLSPDWKSRAFEPGVFLEDQLAAAVDPAPVSDN